jgi:hypothetical protein
MAFKLPFGGANTDRGWIASAVVMDLISSTLPVVVTYFPYPIGNLISILSIVNWKSTLLGWCTESGKPK